MSGEELDEAELFIFRQLQMETYPKAFESLQMVGPVHPKEKIAHLHPVWDPRDKLIRISGRLSLAEIKILSPISCYLLITLLFLSSLQTDTSG
jgi:hypothetical protein